MNNNKRHLISTLIALLSAAAMYYQEDSFSIANRLRYGDISYRDLASALNGLIVGAASYWATRLVLSLIFGKAERERERERERAGL